MMCTKPYLDKSICQRKITSKNVELNVKKIVSYSRLHPISLPLGKMRYNDGIIQRLYNYVCMPRSAQGKRSNLAAAAEARDHSKYENEEGKLKRNREHEK